MRLLLPQFILHRVTKTADFADYALSSLASAKSAVIIGKIGVGNFYDLAETILSNAIDDKDLQAFTRVVPYHLRGLRYKKE